MALPSFVATGNLKEVLGNVSGDELVESILEQAIIECRSNVPLDALVKWGGTMYRILPVPARVDVDGNIVTPTGDPLRLVAQDDGLSIRNLQWQIIITIPYQVIPPSPSGQIKSWWIDAGIDGETVDLETTLPVFASPYKIITQGPAGPGVDDVTINEDGDVVFWVDGSTIGDPLALEVIDISDVDGGTPGSPGIGIIEGGTP